jgi:hypothetical protein
MDMRWHRIRKKIAMEMRGHMRRQSRLAGIRRRQSMSRNEKKNRAGVEKILATPPRGTFACAESSNTLSTADDVECQCQGDVVCL